MFRTSNILCLVERNLYVLHLTASTWAMKEAVNLSRFLLMLLMPLFTIEMNLPQQICKDKASVRVLKVDVEEEEKKN